MNILLALEKNSIRKIFIHAINVHQGGGLTLLSALLRTLPDSAETQILLDTRMQFSYRLSKNIQIKRITPSVIDRFYAERWLANNVCSRDVVLCFGNLPPLFNLRGRVVVFVQNRYLIDDVSLYDLPMRDRIRLSIERLWLSSRVRNADAFFVQTPEMKRLLTIRLQGKTSASIKLLPFVAEPYGYSRGIAEPIVQKCGSGNFLYVATGALHKNHKRLIEAWCLLAKEGLFPRLCLTLDEFQNQALLLDIATMCQNFGVKITNETTLPHSELILLYNKFDALIYPSTLESFGLPLIEARQAGLPVLAPELDYVRDLLDPEQTFDPKSPVSIARAVKRFLGIDELPLPLIDAKEFFSHLTDKMDYFRK